MKKLILLILLIPSLLFAGPLQDRHKAVIANLVAPSGGDGSIGQISHEASGMGAYGDLIYNCEFTPTSGGPINYGHCYITNAGTSPTTLTIFNASGTVLAYGSVNSSGNTAHWANVTLNTEITLVLGTTYILGFNTSDGNYNWAYTASGNLYNDPQTYSATPSAITPQQYVTSGRTIAILFNNTAGSPE